MQRIIRRLTGSLSILFFSSSLALGQSVASGYVIEEFAVLPGPFAIEFAPAGSAYGSELFVALLDPGQVLPDTIVSVSSSGAVSHVATLLPEADPVTLEFPPPGSPFGDVLYVSSNNRDFGQPGDCGGVIQTVDLAGNWADLTTIVGCIECDQSSSEAAGLGEPNAIAFGEGGAYGSDMYVGNGVDQPGGIMRVSLMGETAIFSDDGSSSCTFDSGLVAPFGGFTFGPGGAFGSELYFGDRDPSCECIRTVDASGTISAPLVSLPDYLVGMRFSSGTATKSFGGDLYAFTPQSIYRVASDGSYQLFASGFSGLGLDGLEFSRNGRSLYVADYADDRIYRIRRVNPLQWNAPGRSPVSR